MDDLKQQVKTLTQQVADMQKVIDGLSSFSKNSDDQQSAFSSRLFIRATALPATYTKFLSSTPGGFPVMAICDGFYETENGIYIPFYRVIT